jgi:hypothetical protein
MKKKKRSNSSLNSTQRSISTKKIRFESPIATTDRSTNSGRQKKRRKNSETIKLKKKNKVEKRIEECGGAILLDSKNGPFESANLSFSIAGGAKNYTTEGDDSRKSQLNTARGRND